MDSGKIHDIEFDKTIDILGPRLPRIPGAGVTCMKIQDGVVNRAKTLETLLRITGFWTF